MTSLLLLVKISQTFLLFLKQTLAVVGDVAGRTPFQINLANRLQGKVATYFEPGATVDFNTGRLLNQDATVLKTLTFNFR